MSIIRAEIFPNSNISIQPLSVKRDWMDNVSNAHAYNCFPITITNGLGWGISFPEDIVFIWDGVDTDREEGHIKILKGHQYVNENRRNATISLNTKVKFVTEEDITMLTMPVPNLFLDTVIPFTTLVSTSFFPNPLPAALKIIKPNVEITIPANSTAIAVLPIPLSQIVSNEMHLYDYVSTHSDNLKNKKYGDVAKAMNQKGEWTHFYRDATDENKKILGKHEIKSIKLKTIDKRNHNENK
jgi:hypothetical protein